MQEMTQNTFLFQFWSGDGEEKPMIDPKPLETFPYEHIIFFGAPQPCTYKITVDEREMFFETPQVHFSFHPTPSHF